MFATALAVILLAGYLDRARLRPPGEHDARHTGDHLRLVACLAVIGPSARRVATIRRAPPLRTQLHEPTLRELGEERNRLDERGQAVHARLCETAGQRTGKARRGDREHCTRRDRRPFDDAVDDAVESSVTPAPDVDARRAPIRIEPVPASETRAPRRFTQLNADARHCSERVDEHRRRARHRPAVPSADRLGKPHQPIPLGMFLAPAPVVPRVHEHAAFVAHGVDTADRPTVRARISSIFSNIAAA
jgi:hypothetical protein